VGGEAKAGGGGGSGRGVVEGGEAEARAAAGMAVGGALREGKGRPKRRGWGR
jgi:hypothetical protein